MKSITFPTKVINGTISSNRKPIKEAIASFEGKEIILTISKKSKRRSNDQNAYLWGVVYPIIKNGLKEQGYNQITTEQVHELLKGQFCKEEIVNENTGEIGANEIVRTTAVAQKAMEELNQAMIETEIKKETKDAIIEV